MEKTTRPFRYDLDQIPYDYTVEMRSRFKGLDLMDRVPDELWTEICDIAQETGIKSIPMENKSGPQAITNILPLTLPHSLYILCTINYNLSDLALTYSLCYISPTRACHKLYKIYCVITNTTNTSNPTLLPWWFSW